MTRRDQIFDARVDIFVNAEANLTTAIVEGTLPVTSVYNIRARNANGTSMKMLEHPWHCAQNILSSLLHTRRLSTPFVVLLIVMGIIFSIIGGLLFLHIGVDPEQVGLRRGNPGRIPADGWQACPGKPRRSLVPSVELTDTCHFLLITLSEAVEMRKLQACRTICDSLCHRILRSECHVPGCLTCSLHGTVNERTCRRREFGIFA